MFHDCDNTLRPLIKVRRNDVGSAVFSEEVADYYIRQPEHSSDRREEEDEE